MCCHVCCCCVLQSSTFPLLHCTDAWTAFALHGSCSHVVCVVHTPTTPTCSLTSPSLFSLHCHRYHPSANINFSCSLFSVIPFGSSTPSPFCPPRIYIPFCCNSILFQASSFICVLSSLHHLPVFVSPSFSVSEQLHCSLGEVNARCCYEWRWFCSLCWVVVCYDLVRNRCLFFLTTNCSGGECICSFACTCVDVCVCVCVCMPRISGRQGDNRFWLQSQMWAFGTWMRGAEG